MIRVLLIFSLAAIAFAPRVLSAPPAIVEVQTWGDLLAQKPISLAGTAADPHPVCHVGIDLTHAKLYGGAVLYCLSNADFRTNTSDDLGPFKVDVQTTPRVMEQAAGEKAGGSGEQSSRYFLFMKVVPINLTGDYIVSLRPRESGQAGEGAQLPAAASVKFRVTKDDPALPFWCQWGWPKAGAAQDATGRDSAARVSNPLTSAAIPRWPEAAIGFDKLPGPKALLPQLMPSKPDPALHLSFAGNTLTVKSGKADLLNVECFDSILVRWWINGRPFIPPQPKSNEIMGDETANGATDYEDSYSYLIEFHPEFFHAKKGDVIGAQLLYCPGGYLITRPLSAAAPMLFDPKLFPKGDASAAAISRLSNRIEFTYSGDPAAISRSPVK
jgi:hypothetical protein